MAERRILPRWARWTAAGCAVAVLGAATYLVVDAVPSQAATTGMRTATVATGSVTQSTSLSGPVERVDQVTAAFRTAGTVTSVKVGVGDEVEAGDVLATIATGDLARAVTVAQADLVAAQAALEAAASSTTSSSTSTSGSSTTSAAASGSASTATSPTTGSGSGSTPAPSASPSTPAKGVDTAPVHRAVDDYGALVQAAVTTCQPVIDDGTSPEPTPTPTPSPSETAPTPSPSPSQTPSDEPSATPSPTDSASPTADAATSTVVPASLSTDTPTPEQVSACIQALSSALTSARHTAAEMDRLAAELDAAATALQEQQSKAATQGSTGQPTGTGSGTGGGNAAATGTGSTSGSGGTGGTGGAGGSQSTANLEVEVLKATQELAAAEQDLDGAVLKAPISGRVGQVDLVKGEQAGTSSGLVLVGPGAAVVTVDLPLAQLDKVRVAQDVTVTPAGTTDAVPGVVQSIGVLPSSTTTSTPTYPVRVTVSDAPVSLAAGSTATVAITLATAADVLTVPVSAVTGVSSGTGSVQVLSGGTVTVARVTVGAVGDGKVQVDSGLTAGQVVVLADPTVALPSSNTSTRRSTTSGVSSLTGSGGGVGGPPGR